MTDSVSIKSHAVAGVKWTGLSMVVTSVFQYVQVAVLTKFLLPSDFGIMAMALVLIGLAQAYTDMGISNAVIQRQYTEKNSLSSLYWLEIAAGWCLFASMVLVTPLAVHFFNEPPLGRVMLGTSLIFLITPLGQLFQILLQRDLEFRSLAWIDMSSSLSSTTIAIVAAYFGYGVMALVFGQVAFYGLRSVQFLRIGLARWKPSLHFSRADLKGYLGFGLYQMGERTVTYLSLNIINLIIGKFLGAYVLGHYSLAYQMTIIPITRASTVLMTVSFPIFSKFQDYNELLRDGYIQMTRLISFTILPLLTLIYIIAPVFVPVVLGRQWGDVTPLIQILCIVGAFKALGMTTVPTYLAKGRADIGFMWNFIVATANGVLFYVIARQGIIVLTWSFAALSLIQFAIMQTITGKMIGLGWAAYVGSMVRQLLICASMGFIVYGALLIGRSIGLSELSLFCAMIATSAVSYAFLTLALNGDYAQELKRLIMPA